MFWISKQLYCIFWYKVIEQSFSVNVRMWPQVFNRNKWNCIYVISTVSEPGHRAGSLPQCSLSGRQQTGRDNPQPGPLGRQEGMDEGRTRFSTQADVLQRRRSWSKQRIGNIGKKLVKLSSTTKKGGDIGTF